MKTVIMSCLLLALAWAGAPAAQAPARAAGLRKVPGQEYVRLTDWAKGRGLKVRWLKPDETLELSNPASRLVVAIDSRQAQFNAVQVWLFFPVVAQNGVIWLSRVDADLTLRPLFSPPRSPPGARIKTVCLDPGHGGRDPGNQVGANQEKRFTLLLAQEVKKQLARAGLKVVLTRSGDSYLEPPSRPAVANRHKADLFLSLHFNAAGNDRSTVQGAEVFCLTPAGVASTNARGEGADTGSFTGNRYNDLNLFLAYQVQKSLTRTLAVQDRGVRRARFAVLRDAAMPAVLIEAGFMSHPAEGRKIFTAAYRREVARAIVEGVLACKKTVERGA